MPALNLFSIPTNWLSHYPKEAATVLTGAIAATTLYQGGSWPRVGGAAIASLFLIHSGLMEQGLRSVQNGRCEQRLQAWIAEKEGQPEHDLRIIAAEKIRSCFPPSGRTVLDLTNSGLTSLPRGLSNLQSLRYLNLSENLLESIPEDIGDLKNLQTLNLAYNHLQRLPKTIGHLQTLYCLALHENELFSLPEEIGNLTNVQTLDFSGNDLGSIPKTIGKLQNLQYLNLRENQIRMLPEEIGNCPFLHTLNLSCNQLHLLTDKIGKLSNLLDLDLSENKLRSFPATIGALRKMRDLNLGGNPLTSLPLEIFELDPECKLDLIGCDFSDAVLERIEETISSENYQGPNIDHPLVERMTQTSDRTIDEVLTEIYEIGRQSLPPRFAKLREHPKVNSLEIWLGKISYIADFKKGGEQKGALLKKIIEYLEFAEENSEFRDLFFLNVEEGARTCGNRMALSITRLGIAKRLATISLDRLSELSELLIHGVFAFDEIEKIARGKVARERLVDEIEVHIAYLYHLREALSLPLDVEEILIFRCSNLTENELNNASLLASSIVGDFDNQCRFLANHYLWRKALEKKDPSGFEEAFLSDNPEEALIRLTHVTLSSLSELEAL